MPNAGLLMVLLKRSWSSLEIIDLGGTDTLVCRLSPFPSSFEFRHFFGFLVRYSDFIFPSVVGRTFLSAMDEGTPSSITSPVTIYAAFPTPVCAHGRFYEAARR